MTEGISLAAMTETPVVIVVAQRPGPATGLPTRTEQSDLEFVLHAGHGEFPRAVFAPGSINACFELMCRTFALAEASQGPVFLLTDQFLADSYRDVLPFHLDGAAALVLAPQEPAPVPYRRYAFIASGVSPRRVPGVSQDLVVADSDEHDEEGHITEDLTLRSKMVEKRLRKLTLLTANVVAPEYDGGDAPDLLLVNWGSTKGAVDEAAARMCAEGRSVGTLHFSQVWPLVPSQFLARLQAARRVVSRGFGRPERPASPLQTGGHLRCPERLVPAGDARGGARRVFRPHHRFRGFRLSKARPQALHGRPDCVAGGP